MWAIPRRGEILKSISVAQNQAAFFTPVCMFTTVNPEHYLPPASAWGFAVIADTAFLALKTCAQN